MPGSTTIRFLLIPANSACCTRSRNSRFTKPTISATGGRLFHSSGSPRMCISTRPQDRPATVFFISGSHCSPLTSFTISAPVSTAARATVALYVSTEMRAPGRKRLISLITGSTRRSSSSAATATFSGAGLAAPLAGAPRAAASAFTASILTPGRVDSPPMSRISAPSSSNCRPCSTAWPRSKNWPPSENESGVTFTTPMMSVRRPSSMVRSPTAHWKMGRMGRL